MRSSEKREGYGVPGFQTKSRPGRARVVVPGVVEVLGVFRLPLLSKSFSSFHDASFFNAGGLFFFRRLTTSVPLPLDTVVAMSGYRMQLICCSAAAGVVVAVGRWLRRVTGDECGRFMVVWSSCFRVCSRRRDRRKRVRVQCVLRGRVGLRLPFDETDSSAQRVNVAKSVWFVTQWAERVVKVYVCTCA